MAETFHNAYHDVTTVDTAVVTAGSGETLIVLTCRATNVDGTASATVNARVLDSDSSTDAKLSHTIMVPADSSIELAGTSKIVLETGDKLYLEASADGDIEAFVSYLKIT